MISNKDKARIIFGELIARGATLDSALIPSTADVLDKIDVLDQAEHTSSKPKVTRADATQQDCKALFVEAMKQFNETLDRIDLITPFSEVEPEWWLDMVALNRKICDRITKYDKQ